MYKWVCVCVCVCRWRRVAAADDVLYAEAQVPISYGFTRLNDRLRCELRLPRMTVRSSDMPESPMRLLSNFTLSSCVLPEESINATATAPSSRILLLERSRCVMLVCESTAHSSRVPASLMSLPASSRVLSVVFFFNADTIMRNPES